MEPRRSYPRLVLAVAALLIATLVRPPAGRAVTRCEVLDRAQAWVDAGVMYSWNAWYTDPTTGQGPYRTDCSGYVSAVWGLLPPGHTTYSFAGGPWDTGLSYEIPASDLKPGDALNYPGDPATGTGHMMIYISGSFSSGLVEVYEEYSHGNPAVRRVRSITPSLYRPIRFVDIEPCCTASPEECNGIDDDCNGQIDEDWPELGTPCTVGFGVCQATGVYVCSAYGSSAVCDAIPAAPTSELCDGADGLDNDCDGVTDENANATEECNGIDDNCNGEIDEGNVCFVYRSMFADFDGDGASDLLLQGRDASHGTMLLLADGSGGFHDAVSVTAQFGMTAALWSAASRNLIAADFNGDGAADILLQAISTNHGSLLLMADGLGGFYDAVSVTTQYGMTAGFWSSGARNLNVGDFNGDGSTDVILQGKNNTEGTLLLLADGAGGFEPVRSVTTEFGMTAGKWGGGARYLFVGDYSGDGHDDVLLQGRTGSDGTILLLADGTGGFANEMSVTTQFAMSGPNWSAASRNLFVGHFDTDGKADILLQGRSGSDGTLLLRGSPTGFTTMQSITAQFGMTAANWSALSRNLIVGDYNGDAVTDILLQGRSGSDGTLLLIADGSGGFAGVQSITTAFGMSAPLWNAANRNRFIGDFDGNGTADIVLQGGSDTDGTLLLLADGSGGFQSYQSITALFGMSAPLWNATNRHLHTGHPLRRRRDGAVCSLSAHCLSGHCVDGVCCLSPCDETCVTCAAVGLEGLCTAVVEGTNDGVDCGPGPDAEDCAGSSQGIDADGDFFVAAACGGDDCDDADPEIHPGASETCDDGVDQNCDGEDLSCDCDGDGDGYPALACGGDDCDDTDSAVNPGASETCDDGVDNNCDGEIDSADTDCAPRGGSSGCDCAARGEPAHWSFGLFLLLLVFIARRGVGAWLR